MFADDESLFRSMVENLYSPVLGDVLDTLGYSHQFLPQPIQPMRPTMRLVGRAMPVQVADAWGKQAHPFGRMTEALDDLRPDEIYIATGGSHNCAAWGEIMTAAARTRRAAGAIVDGFHRDTPKVLEQQWPVFSRGRYAQDAGIRSRVIDFRCRIEIGSVVINPADLIFADLDGIIVIPRAVENEAVPLALEKARAEKVVRREIENGMSTTEAFHKYGIL